MPPPPTASAGDSVQLHEKSGNRPTTEQIISLVTTSPEKIHEALQAQGSGVRRDTIVRNLLDAASDTITPPKAAAAIEILKIIDANATRQENHLTFLNDVHRIVRQIGATESLQLLATIKHAPIRETLAYGIGSELARMQTVQMEMWDQVKSLDSRDQLKILRIYGDKLDRFHSHSLTTAAELLGSLPFDEAQKAAIASAYFHSTDLYSSSDLLEACASHGDTWLGAEMFGRGLILLQQQGTKETAAYLTSAKAQLPELFYQEAVASLVSTLARSGDIKSAIKWQDELPIDQRMPLASRN